MLKTKKTHATPIDREHLIAHLKSAIIFFSNANDNTREIIPYNHGKRTIPCTIQLPSGNFEINGFPAAACTLMRAKFAGGSDGEFSVSMHLNVEA